MSLSSSRSPKRRRLNDERCSRCDTKKHLYLALDDWSGGYSVHKLDPDDLPEHLSEPPAVRVTGPDFGTISFAAFGANLHIAINPRCFGVYPRAPPTLIYSTETTALTIGPRLPNDHCCDLDNAVAAGGKLYAMSSVFDKDSATFSNYWQILESTGDEDLWDPSYAWSWRRKPTPPFMNREAIVSHALHPDGRTIFLSTESQCTYSLDTSNGEFKELGDWVLPSLGKPTTTPSSTHGSGSTPRRMAAFACAEC
jgi:hypothetical protein